MTSVPAAPATFTSVPSMPGFTKPKAPKTRVIQAMRLKPCDVAIVVKGSDTIHQPILVYVTDGGTMGRIACTPELFSAVNAGLDRRDDTDFIIHVQRLTDGGQETAVRVDPVVRYGDQRAGYAHGLVPEHLENVKYITYLTDDAGFAAVHEYHPKVPQSVVIKIKFILDEMETIRRGEKLSNGHYVHDVRSGAGGGTIMVEPKPRD